MRPFEEDNTIINKLWKKLCSIRVKNMTKNQNKIVNFPNLLIMFVCI